MRTSDFLRVDERGKIWGAVDNVSTCLYIRSMNFVEKREQTVKKLQALSDLGFTKAEAAYELGVSRQYVGRVSLQSGIKWSTQYKSDRPTGGVYTTNIIKGAAAELLVAADLLVKGWSVYRPLVNNRGHDLIAYLNDNLITIEVRSARRGVEGQPLYPTTDNKVVKSSHFAIVCHGRPIKFEPGLPDR